MMALKLIAAACIVLGGCGGKALKPSGDAAAHDVGGHAGTSGPPDDETSPGTVTLRFTAPPSSYCDVTCGTPLPHITIYTAGKEALVTDVPFCGTRCSTHCEETFCPAIGGVCPLTGLAVTDAEVTWDGHAYVMSTCGEGQFACHRPMFVAAGTYIARMCATPGTLSASADGTPVCTATGPLECVDVTFEFPGKSVVTGALGGPKSCHAMSAAAYDQTCATDSDCVDVPEGNFCDGKSCTNCVNAAINLKAHMQYEADLAMNVLRVSACPCPANASPACDHGKCVLGTFGRPPGP